MTDHIETLKQYQRWRRGEEDWSPDDRGPDPKELGDVIDKTIAEVEMLRAAINQTLNENGHLSDGRICTLRLLKDAIGEE